MKCLLYLGLLLWCPLTVLAQAVRQEGYVREITYSKQEIGAPIADVKIKVETEARSNKSGSFMLSITPNGEKTFVFDYIYKIGYSLISPKENELRVKKYAINNQAKIEIILVRDDELFRERQRIERSIRDQKEEEIASYKKQLEQKEVELSRLKDKSVDYQKLLAECDSLKSIYHSFSRKYYGSDKLIMEEADKLAHIDYQTLDSIELKNVELRKAGKGKELVEYNKNLLPKNEAEIIKSLEANIDQSDKNIQVMQTTLQQKQEKSQQLKNFRDHLVRCYQDIALGFRLQYKNDSVTVYLKKIVDLDSKNYDYSMEYGGWLTDMAHYDKARKVYELLLSACLLKYSEESEQVGALYNNIGNIYFAQANYSEALFCYRKALAIQERIDNPSITVCYDNIGKVYDALGNYSEALNYFQKALSIREKVLIPDHPAIALSYNNIGNIYSSLGNYSKALFYYEKTLMIHEKIWGLEHVETATTYSNIGYVYYCQGDYSRALLFYQKAIEIQKRILGQEHPDVAVLYNNIGSVYSAQDNDSEALSCYEKALVILEKIFDSGHPAIAKNYNGIGEIYFRQGNFSEALSFHQKALSMLKKFVAPDHSDIAILYNNIGDIYFCQDNSSEALSYYQKALQIEEKIMSPDRLEIAESYYSIGNVYVAQNNACQALSYYQKALTILEKKNGESDLSLNQVYGNIIKLLPFIIASFQQDGDTLNVNKYITMQAAYLKNIVFTAEIVEDVNSKAYQQGLKGIYYVLYYEGWECDRDDNLFKHDVNLGRQLKKLVLMKDGKILEYQLGDETEGVEFNTVYLSREEKLKIIDAYHQWKK